MTDARWAIITGEYPPQPGGVSDYTQLVATALAEAGDEVHVWAPPSEGGECHETPRLTIHRLPGCFDSRSLRQLARDLSHVRVPYRLLVQYAPHAFGWKAMNLPFCLWLSSRSRRQVIWTMFHEVRFPFRLRQPLRHNLVAGATALMAFVLARASSRILVSIPAWTKLLPAVDCPVMCQGIPSTAPTIVDESAAATLRAHLLKDDRGALIGHFGTYGSAVTEHLAPILVELLTSDESRRALLLGRHGENFKAELVLSHPRLARQLVATGALSPDLLAVNIAACDAVVQPYPDGISGRRTTAMAALSLGIPVITNDGELSEPFWRDSGAVVLTTSLAPESFVAATNEVLASQTCRTSLAERGRALYDSKFAIARTIETLRQNPRVTQRQR